MNELSVIKKLLNINNVRQNIDTGKISDNKTYLPYSTNVIDRRISSFKDVLRFIDNVAQSTYIQAIKEALQIELIKLQTTANRIEYLFTHREAVRAEEHWYFYSSKSKRLLNSDLRLEDLNFKFAYSIKQGFMLVKHIPTILHDDIYLMGKEIDFIRERDLLTLLKLNSRVLAYYPFNNVKFYFYNGVPGAGKTYEIVHEFMKLPIGTAMICTSTKAGRKEIIQKLKTSSTFSQSNIFRYVRTYDSITMHGGKKIGVLFADEALMSHYGQILMVVALLGAVKVYCFGDYNQIPYNSRLPEFEVKHAVIPKTSMSLRVKSYRLGENAVRLLKQFYGKDGIISAYHYQDEIKVTIISSIEQIKYDSDIKYVTFTQYEKSLLNSHFDKKVVNTVHEIQGHTFEHLKIVRVISQDNVVFKSRPHIIVALSRHTRTLEYLTVTNDLFADILRGKSVSGFEEFGNYDDTVYRKTGDFCYYGHNEIVVSYPRRFPYIGNFFFTNPSSKVVSLSRKNYMKLNIYIPHIPWFDDPVGVIKGFIDHIPHPTDADLAAIENSRRVLHFDYKEIYNRYAYDKAIIDADCYKPERLITSIVRSPIKIEVKNDIYSMDYSLNKRNRNPPLMNVIHDEHDVNAIVDRFFYVFIDNQRLYNAQVQKPTATVGDFNNWMATRNPRVRNIIEQLNQKRDIDYLNEKDIALYDVHLKTKVKVKLDGSHLTEEPAAQVITAMDNELSAAFTPYIKQLDFYVKASLKDQFLINDGININDLNCFINHITSFGDHKFVETDFSKFDKSQESLALEIQCEIMRRMGIQRDVVDLWYRAHLVNKLKIRKFGVRIRTKYQRRSGDVLTFLGNTLVLMATIAYCYPLETYFGGVFGGDDSLIVVPSHVVISRDTTMFSTRFNFYVKLEDTSKSVFFASKLLIRSFVGYYYFVPDPIKMLIKLCRDDLTCYEHLVEFRRNYHLMCNLFVNHELGMVAEALNARYPKMGFYHDAIINSIMAMEFLLSSDKRFKQFYNITSTAYKRKLAPLLKEKLLKQRAFYDI